jgi:hypothetical protein
VRFGRPRKLNPKQGTLAQPFSSEGNLVRQVAETFIVHAPTIYPLSGGGRLSVFSVPLLPNTQNRRAGAGAHGQRTRLLVPA